MNDREWLKKNGFKLYTEMGLTGENRLDILTKNLSQDDKASVYAWVSKDNPPTVLYVGKAGKGVKRRLDQHIGGFNNGKNTRKKMLMLEYLEDQRSFEVYVRLSENTTIFGHEVTLNSAEEHALYEEFNPPWNIAGFPDVKVKDRASKSKLSEAIEGENLQINLLFELEDLPYSEDAIYFWNSLSLDDRKTLSRIFDALTRLTFTKILDCRLVKQYSDIGPRYSGKTTINFGEWAIKQFKPNSWCARIPLSLPLTVFFPTSIINESKRSGEEKTNILSDQIVDFCNDPWSFINESELKKRLSK